MKVDLDIDFLSETINESDMESIFIDRSHDELFVRLSKDQDRRLVQKISSMHPGVLLSFVDNVVRQ